MGKGRESLEKAAENLGIAVSSMVSECGKEHFRRLKLEIGAKALLLAEQQIAWSLELDFVHYSASSIL